MQTFRLRCKGTTKFLDVQEGTQKNATYASFCFYLCTVLMF